MIRVSSLKLKVDHSNDDILNAVSKKLRLNKQEITEFKIIKKSLDARDKNNIRWNYIVDIGIKNEGKIYEKFKNNQNISISESIEYKLPPQGSLKAACRPYIIGSGPAGLFCAYFLSEYGYRPVLIEQGQCISERIKTVNRFWKENKINPLSNVQFGEGGAGTFSDGKLNTGVNDRHGRNMKVLETFVLNGASEEILYMNKPHIGTDSLVNIVTNMRNRIIKNGGEVFFDTKLTDISVLNNSLKSIFLENNGITTERPCSLLVLAIGHSARDTFYMLNKRGLDMRSKGFAVGIRVEHLQEDINKSMYGENYRQIYGNNLPPADYKLTYRAKDGRGVYSFCMCPGGYVVNSSSQEGLLCVNGMSYSKRDGKNANSAIVITVNPDDADSYSNPLKGFDFIERLEKAAYLEGKGSIPVQKLSDFKLNKTGTNNFTKVMPAAKGQTACGNLNKIFPEFICSDIKEAFDYFGRKIKGFDDSDTVLSAVESRTSSPVRILRDDFLEAKIKGIYPAGEGAGYSGGITSSAIDGIKVFEEIYKKYAPL